MEWEQRTIFDLLGNTEIGNLNAALVVDKDIPAFDVSMNDLFLMEIGKPFQDLPNKILDQGFLKGAIIP